MANDWYLDKNGIMQKGGFIVGRPIANQKGAELLYCSIVLKKAQTKKKANFFLVLPFQKMRFFALLQNFLLVLLSCQGRDILFSFFLL